ncbi:hypothetical protein BsWGS_21884 [Bradybaena similaris]
MQQVKATSHRMPMLQEGRLVSLLWCSGQPQLTEVKFIVVLRSTTAYRGQVYCGAQVNHSLQKTSLSWCLSQPQLTEDKFIMVLKPTTANRRQVYCGAQVKHSLQKTKLGGWMFIVHVQK